MGDLSIKEIVSVSLILFSVIDIIGSIPIILQLEEKNQRRIDSLRATIYATFVMIAFLFIGKAILMLFGLDVQSFSIAGALVLFLIGLEMVLSIEIFKYNTEGADTTIIPLVFPLIAGPGTMTTIITLNAEFSKYNVLIGILVNMIFVYVVLRYSNFVSRMLGPTGRHILHKAFGLILLAISIKLFKNQLLSILSVIQQ